MEPPGALDHRFLSIYVALYRTEIGAWYRLHIEWLESWIPNGSCGGLPLRECLDASWDAQGQLELAAMRGDPMAIVILDYYKYFDYFELRFTGKFLEASGIHSDFTVC